MFIFADPAASDGKGVHVGRGAGSMDILDETGSFSSSSFFFRDDGSNGNWSPPGKTWRELLKRYFLFPSPTKRQRT
jgi:hypothetical protein